VDQVSCRYARVRIKYRGGIKLENCEHNTFHRDCCVCWHKQGLGDYYPNQVPLFIDKMAAILMNKDWRTYCLEMALQAAKDKFESNYPDFGEFKNESTINDPDDGSWVGR